MKKLILVSLCVLFFLASPAVAVSVYSTSFEESEGYILGDLHGQQGWVGEQSPGECFVQFVDSSSGSWVVQIIPDGSCSYTALHYGAERLLPDPTAANPVVTISQDVKITALLDEARYFILVLGTDDLITNGLTFSPSGKMLLNHVDTGYSWTPNVWRPNYHYNP